MVSGSDHFYTTSTKDFSASGYRFEGITGYLNLKGCRADSTVPLYHWYNPTIDDNFYTTLAPKSHTYSREPDPLVANGYQYRSQIGQIFQNPHPGAVPLLRWWHKDLNNHFYTTHRRGEMAPSSGYLFEGVTGYVYPEPMFQTIPLFRWYRRSADDEGVSQ